MLEILVLHAAKNACLAFAAQWWNLQFFETKHVSLKYLFGTCLPFCIAAFGQVFFAFCIQSCLHLLQMQDHPN